MNPVVNITFLKIYFLACILLFMVTPGIVLGLTNIECYKCNENSLNDDRIQCAVMDNEKFQLDEDLLEDLLDPDFELDEYDLDNIQLNPCHIVGEKVFQIIESQDQALLPIDLGLGDLTDKKTKEAVFQTAISTILFQKRQNSDWIIVEVEQRDTLDVFSFIVQDFELQFLSIPDDSIFLVAL